jgi:hypothetical protein
MTSAEWQTYTDPEAMLVALDRARFSPARLPVVLAGFADRGRLFDALVGHFRQHFLDYARWVFGLSPRPLPIELPVHEPQAERTDASALEDSVRAAMCGVGGWRTLIRIAEAEAYGTWRIDRRHPHDPVARRWAVRQAYALRDALGHPFAPVRWEPSWRTETVTALATAIHYDNAFDRLPILGDALEEAGCDDEEVLTHCRGPFPHARGCWVVDAARGKGRAPPGPRGGWAR